MSDPAELLSTQPTAKDLSRQDGVWSPQVVHAAPAPANVSPVYPHTSMSANYLQSPMPAPAAQQAAAITPIGAPFAAASVEPRPSFAAPVSPADLNRPAAQYASPAPSPPLRTHTIIDGDSLTKLAGRYLRDPARSDEIFALNRDVLENPDLLPIGAELKLPAVNATGRGG
jgi:nucleoid-associated protein YgaU